MGLKLEERELIKKFILESVEKHPNDIVLYVSRYFSTSRQTIHKYLKRFLQEGILEVEGKTRNVKYKLKTTEHIFNLTITPSLHEDQVWSVHVVPNLPKLKKNVYDICNYAFSEMMNNIIDHSDSNSARIVMSYDAVQIHFLLIDFGIGIFKKIQKYLNLDNPKHSILELAKGKFTTDSANHSGEGIYFTSRVCDDFDILSQNIYFHGEQGRDWLSDEKSFTEGTVVFMDINRESNKTNKEIFDAYAPSENDYGFSKTKIPVRLLKHEGEELVSRSQAKRLVVRFDRFKEVVLDFEGVKTIGQGFADELFRVFVEHHPEVILTWINTSKEIDRAIVHVLANKK
ncbi:MAG: DUF4325 domain-containing protein [Candidatus Aadella gelida]|nr:DUF4325 domain-containing protein [Candidatus Aadella gelida]